MKNKVFFIFFSIYLTVVSIYGLDTDASNRIAVDNGIINILQKLWDSGADISDLKFYLSNTLVLAVINERNKEPQLTITNGAIAAADPNQWLTVKIDINDEGLMVKYPPPNNGIIEILFLKDGKPYVLSFKKDAEQKFFICFSAVINSRSYRLESQSELPRLFVKTALNTEENEVFVFLSNEPSQAARNFQGSMPRFQQTETRGQEHSAFRHSVRYNKLPPVDIMTDGVLKAQNLAQFLLDNNPQADPAFVFRLAGYYIEEANYEGVNHDIAFAQMCLETGYLKFGGIVLREWNNFCGLGAFKQGEVLRFPDPRIGVRAQIQHLKAYASVDPLNKDLVDGRFHLVKPRGKSPTIDGLAGTWAEDRQYAVKIHSILKRMYNSSF